MCPATALIVYLALIPLNIPLKFINILPRAPFFIRAFPFDTTSPINLAIEGFSAIISTLTNESVIDLLLLVLNVLSIDSTLSVKPDSFENING